MTSQTTTHDVRTPVAYFVNQYPKVSHSFIRREILALERQGFAVQRIALRGWDAELPDPEDQRERERTLYVLRDGLGAVLIALLSTAFLSPLRFVAALTLALRLSRGADRSWPYHLVYLAEACRVLVWIRHQAATHVHAHFGTNSAEVAMLVHALGGPPYSFTVHGPEEFDKALRLGLAEKARYAAFVVAVSSYGRSQIYRWLDPADWEKVKVVHCGLDATYLQAPPASQRTAPQFVCVGRLCAQKGQLLLLEALHELTQKGIYPQLVFAGDGEMRPEIEAAIASHGLNQQVRITGWIGGEEVRHEILAARALVLPSFAEGLPVVIMEAMALQRPVISTYVAGIPELVRPGIDGWLVPSGDAAALAAAMADCLTRSVEALRAMGEAAQRRVTERHSVDTEAAKLAALFRGARE